MPTENITKLRAKWYFTHKHFKVKFLFALM